MIAAGSMGTVFEARDTFVERNVALKLMHPHLASDPELVARFRREAQAAARIQHPNVVTVLEVGKRRDGTFYIVHELLAGRTLRHVLETNPRRAVGEILSIALPIMGGLAAAHACGIVHRDIKPENIILSVTPSGELVPKIVDFGIAKMSSQEGGKKGLTHFGMIMGTPHYMAPEQALGGSVDMRTDIWAMGAMLFEMFTGAPPFDGDTPEEVLRKVVAEEPPRLSSLAPEAAPFAEVIHRALKKNPADRPPTMEIFTEALLGASQGGHRPLFVTSIEATDQITLKITMNPMPPLSALESEDRASLPPVEEEPEPPTLRVSMTSLEPPHAQGRARLGQSEMEWRAADTITVPYEADRAAEAERLLSVNALRDAIERARVAMSTRDVSPDVGARMSLVEAIARCWLGEYESAANAAHQALVHFERGTTGWHAALGHHLIANGHLGRKTVISVSAKELTALEDQGEATNPAHVVSCCRLVLFAVRLGQVRLAERSLEQALRHAGRPGDAGPFVAAWLNVARGELSLHRGDLTAYLQRVQSAAELFTSASDLRNSCLQRANVGNALLLLGAYEQAVTVLRESIGVAEPMQLALVAGAKANLGLALAYIGGLDEGIVMTNEALGQFRKQRNARAEATALVYLSRMHVMKKRLGEAAVMAEEAARLAEGIPAVRAHALAMQASIELANQRASVALDRASQAMDILKGLSGVEEGESLIRLAHAAALQATGRTSDAKRRVEEARAGLMTKAKRIGDERWRQVFLQNDPDNAQLMRLAKKLLGH
nr:serine/threonine-protein kinase [Polyangium spumosum]